MFTIEAYVLYKLISKLRNEYNLSNILQKKLRQKKILQKKHLVSLKVIKKLTVTTSEVNYYVLDPVNFLMY